MGGSGGGSSTSTSQASFPPEFRPLARTAVGQIQSLQDVLPLAQFGQEQPIFTAGISPFQQAASNIIPQTLQPTAGLQSLAQLAEPIGTAATEAFGAGAPTPIASLVTGGLLNQQTTPTAQFAQQTPQNFGFPSVVPGQTAAEQQALVAQLSNPIPNQTPALPPITPNAGQTPASITQQFLNNILGQTSQINALIARAQPAFNTPGLSEASRIAAGANLIGGLQPIITDINQLVTGTAPTA